MFVCLFVLKKTNYHHHIDTLSLLQAIILLARGVIRRSIQCLASRDENISYAKTSTELCWGHGRCWGSNRWAWCSGEFGSPGCRGSPRTRREAGARAGGWRCSRALGYLLLPQTRSKQTWPWRGVERSLRELCVPMAPAPIASCGSQRSLPVSLGWSRSTGTLLRVIGKIKKKSCT